MALGLDDFDGGQIHFAYQNHYVPGHINNSTLLVKLAKPAFYSILFVYFFRATPLPPPYPAWSELLTPGSCAQCPPYAWKNQRESKRGWGNVVLVLSYEMGPSFKAGKLQYGFPQTTWRKHLPTFEQVIIKKYSEYPRLSGGITCNTAERVEAASQTQNLYFTFGINSYLIRVRILG